MACVCAVMACVCAVRACVCFSGVGNFFFFLNEVLSWILSVCACVRVLSVCLFRAGVRVHLSVSLFVMYMKPLSLLLKRCAINNQ